MGFGLDRNSYRCLDLVLRHVGVGASSRVVSRDDLWNWEILTGPDAHGRSRSDWSIAFVGTIHQCLEIQRVYENTPHIIITAWGDPVCCN